MYTYTVKILIWLTAWYVFPQVKHVIMYYMYYPEFHQAEFLPKIFKHVTKGLTFWDHNNRMVLPMINSFPSLTKHPVTACIYFTSAGYMYMYFNYERLVVYNSFFNLLPASFLFIIRTTHLSCFFFVYTCVVII